MCRTLAGDIRKLIQNREVAAPINERVEEFLYVGSEDSFRWFEELVYCILTANFKAEAALRCVDLLNRRNLVLNGSESDVVKALKDAGHRFPSTRASYIVKARKWIPVLKDKISEHSTSSEAREWLVYNVKGIGWKEASHFLRNVGRLDVAILDRHVLQVMRDYGLIRDAKKGLTRKKYLEYETILRRIAKDLSIEVGKLDLFLWFMKTGKVVK